MDFCVLGLLMIRDMALYELNKAFNTTLSLFFSGSMGSLQAAVRRLEERGLITRTEAYHGKRVKKAYRILPAGCDAFFSEMMSEISSSRLEETALARLSFLGHLENDERRAEALTIMERAISGDLSQLLGMQREYGAMDMPEEAMRIARWQLETLEYGIRAHRMALKFFADLRLELGTESGP